MLLHNLEWVAEGVRHFVEKRRAKRSPFFAYVGWTLPHNPEVLTSLQADPRYTPGGAPPPRAPSSADCQHPPPW